MNIILLLPTNVLLKNEHRHTLYVYKTDAFLNFLSTAS